MSKAKDRGREISFEGRYSRQGVKQPFGYTGYRYDSVGDTYFAQAREYQPAHGRFLAEDIRRGRTAIPKTRNRYGYCWNNPVGMVDLNGMEPELPDMNTLLQQLRPQGESMEPQAPEFVNPFEILGEDRREEPSFPSPQDLLRDYDGSDIVENEVKENVDVSIFGFSSTHGTVGYAGWGIQVVTDFKGHWDIQRTATTGIMTAAKGTWTFSLGRLTVPEFENAAGAGSEVGIGFAAAYAGGYNFIGAYDDEGYRIGEGGMFYFGGGAEFPTLDGHVGATYSKSLKD